MVRRACYLILVGIALASEAGCCCCGGGCWPNGRTWCGPQCGQFIWSEWFSLPPDCCDPCDCCGDYVASRNPYVRRGGPAMGPRRGQFAGGPQQFAPDDGATYSQPPMGPAMGPTMGPPPTEELPPGMPSAATYINELGQTVSYNGPVDSPRTSRRLGDRQPRDLAR